MLPYAHPLFGFVVVGLLLWVGSRGLRARQRRPDAPAARATHRRWAPRVLVLTVLAAIAGTGSVSLVRDDLAPGASWHFRIAWTVVGLLGAAAILSRQFAGAPNARQAHAIVGILAMLGALVGLLLGLGILPD